MQAIVSATYNSGLGYLWVGVTYVYESGKQRYLSSEGNLNSTGATLDGLKDDEDCAVIANDRFSDESCNRSYYAVCELESQI